MIQHKYFAKPCDRDGIKFPSQLERSFYDQLLLRQKAGLVLFFLRQPKFDLPGGARYTADFQIFNTDGTVEFVDIKGVMTEASKLRIRLVESLYPVTIKIIKKV